MPQFGIAWLLTESSNQFLTDKEDEAVMSPAGSSSGVFMQFNEVFSKVHDELNIYFSFHGKKYCKTTLHGYYGITMHEEKIIHFTFHRKKRADPKSRKYPLPPSKQSRYTSSFCYS